MSKPHYELSAHAALVMAARNIDAALVDRALSEPERTEADRFDPELMHALLPIAERDHRVLRVVYNWSVHPLRVVTVYFDRRQRGKS
jgi:hypothetical protein